MGTKEIIMYVHPERYFEAKRAFKDYSDFKVMPDDLYSDRNDWRVEINGVKTK